MGLVSGLHSDENLKSGRIAALSGFEIAWDPLLKKSPVPAAPEFSRLSDGVRQEGPEVRRALLADIAVADRIDATQPVQLAAALVAAMDALAARRNPSPLAVQIASHYSKPPLDRSKPKADLPAELEETLFGAALHKLVDRIDHSPPEQQWSVRRLIDPTVHAYLHPGEATRDFIRHAFASLEVLEEAGYFPRVGGNLDYGSTGLISR